jgi:glycosyltransferase involved in cell wall biosynthesis
MRVAYVSADPGVPVFGSKGCSVHVQEVIRALGRAGVEVELHTVRTGGTAPADLESVEVFEIPFDRKGGREAIEERGLAANADFTASLSGRPAYDMVYERYSLWGQAGMEFARGAGLPGILEVNAPLVEEQATHRTLVHRDEAEAIATRVFSLASGVVAVSSDAREYVCANGGAPERVHVIPNGVDPGRFVPAEAGAPERPFSVGFVGSLKPWHDLDTLVAGYVLLLESQPEARLLIVGDGPERERIEANLDAAGAGAGVTFSGAIAPAEVPQWIQAMDVGAAPYARDAARYFSPLKVLEYMASGIPVVGSRTGQIPELVEEGVAGLLHEAEDAAGLAQALDTLARDPEARGRMGQAARSSVIAHHSWDSVVATTLGLARDAGGHGGSA